MYVYSLKIEVGNTYCLYIKFNLLAVDVTQVGTVLTVLNSICANGNNLKFVTVPWSDVQDSVRTEMVEYVREMMSSSGVSLPTRSIIGKRIKRYYRSQRHQAQIKADKEKRRRQRFLNKRNRLTMVGLYYIFYFHTQMA